MGARRVFSAVKMSKPSRPMIIIIIDNAEDTYAVQAINGLITCHQYIIITTGLLNIIIRSFEMPNRCNGSLYNIIFSHKYRTYAMMITFFPEI